MAAADQVMNQHVLPKHRRYRRNRHYERVETANIRIENHRIINRQQ